LKILGINASPRGSKSQTLRLVKAVLDGAKESGAETGLVDLCTLDINYCNACGTCYAKGECIYDDDFVELYRKILDCDGVLPALPFLTGGAPPAPLYPLILKFPDSGI
jgi:multimeric flavodoxin WrbA